MKIFVRFFLFFTVFLFWWICLAPHGEWIESENRYITPFDFTSEAFCDRLPFRRELMLTYRNLNFALGQNEFSGAFFGKSGYMFSTAKCDRAVLERNFKALDMLSENTDISISLVLIPQKRDVLYTYLPLLYADDRSELWLAASEREMYVDEVLPMLLQKGSEGKYIYYRSDHHLTSLGSYYVYRSLASRLGYAAYGASDFSVSVVKSDFSGSEARKLLTEGGDKISLFRYEGDNDFYTLNFDENRAYMGFYDYDKLTSHDPYGIFPVADCSYICVRGVGEREKLLLLCDSYGDSLIPFLARHFDIDAIDPRYYYGSVKELINENEYAHILACFGMDTVAVGEVLANLYS